jgi:hypothetical protein
VALLVKQAGSKDWALTDEARVGNYQGFISNRRRLMKLSPIATVARIREVHPKFCFAWLEQHESDAKFWRHRGTVDGAAHALDLNLEPLLAMFDFCVANTTYRQAKEAMQARSAKRAD